ncbi:glycerol kinase [Olsenella sp. Marseille-P4559]|uniref:FGGY-family carbohydrate kinase n=1 Tax=Olsenella sp. Marseille-P4559 TaxID=2364795 RepID=UPI0010309BAF|nr:glycerol kinase GlpK [Olsenella sp. Marseille-P4559]
MGGLILAIDQSTQGTKALLFEEDGSLLTKTSHPHTQYVDERGWVEHDAEEVLRNVCSCVAAVMADAGATAEDIAAFGISNQRETCLAWDRTTGRPLAHAIVWQYGRAAALCDELEEAHPGAVEFVQGRSGLALSPYFSAAKMSWMLKNVPAVAEAAKAGTLCFGTIDSWLAYSLCEGHPFVTEPSNATRTQLLNLETAQWDEGLLDLFGIPRAALPKVLPSDALFGVSDFNGTLSNPIPLHAMLGDSQAALAAQDCLKPGQVKATYGTGSSVMLMAGDAPIRNTHGLVSSIAWSLEGKLSYVLEGNLNYTGAVVTWLKDRVHMIQSPDELEGLIREANPNDRSYFVPAFTGLGAPWWDSAATGMLTGVTTLTGRAEIAKACTECIPYQIADVLDALRADTGLALEALRADGGVTKNACLMQFQADMAKASVEVSKLAELSAAGAAFVAGRAADLWTTNAIHERYGHETYMPQMADAMRKSKRAGWQAALRQACCHS